VPAPKPTNGRRKRRLSAKGLANIRAGVAKRMAMRGGGAVAKAQPKRTVSAAVRKARSLALKRRWAKAKASGRTEL